MPYLDLQEWSNLGPGNAPVLKGLNLEGDSALEGRMRALTESGKLEIRQLRSGVELRSSSWVGQLALGTLTVRIRPKIAGLPLLRLLRYAYALRDLNRFPEGLFARAPLSFVDLLVEQLAAEATDLLARGLHRDYLRHHAELSSPRGRLNFAALVRSQSAATARLPCTYFDRSQDILLNRVLLAGVELGRKAATDRPLRARLARLSQVMGQTIAPLALTGPTLEKALRVVDRRNLGYTPALTLTQLLYEGIDPALGEPADPIELPGFLFDMNRFFQRLVSRFLNADLEGHSIRDEHRLPGLFTPDARRPLRWPPVVPRPDFAVVAAGKVVELLDAKYRDLWETPLPPSMLYQLAIYALSRDSPHPRATILYPALAESAKEQAVRIRGPTRDEHRGEVVLRPVNLLYLEHLVSAGPGVAASRARHRFARFLAFGG